MLPVHISLCYANDTDLDYTLVFEDMPRKCEGTKKPDFHSHTHMRTLTQKLLAVTHFGLDPLRGEKISQTFHLSKHLLFSKSAICIPCVHACVCVC